MSVNHWHMCCICILACLRLCGQEVPAGTTLQARFSVATGSRTSHRGDPIAATVIAPVILQDKTFIPQGAEISGAVGDVEQLGFGLKHKTASIRYRFDRLQLPNGETMRIDAQLIKLETAKERVDLEGIVFGVHPLANLSSASDFYTLPLVILNPIAGVPVWGVKALIAPSTSPEVYFPAGTEFLLRLNSPLQIGEPIKQAKDREPKTSDVFMAEAEWRGLSIARAQSGKSPSDYVNLMVTGTRRQIERAFQAAGWSPAEGRSPVSLYRMYNALTRRVGYLKAPMKRLSLDGKYPDFVYQKSLDTIAKRHHVRFWKQSAAGNVWLGTATEDVALTFQSMHWTHRSDSAIDNERAKVTNDLAYTGCIESVRLLPRGNEVKSDAMIVTDGNLASIKMNSCDYPRSMPGIDHQTGPFPTRLLPRLAVSFRDDLVRANPFFTGFNALRSLALKRGLERSVQAFVPDRSATALGSR